MACNNPAPKSGDYRSIERAMFMAWMEATDAQQALSALADITSPVLVGVDFHLVDRGEFSALLKVLSNYLKRATDEMEQEHIALTQWYVKTFPEEATQC